MKMARLWFFIISYQKAAQLMFQCTASFRTHTNFIHTQSRVIVRLFFSSLVWIHTTNESKRCSKRVELSRVGSVGLDRFGLVWPGSGSGYGFGFCFSYCPGCGSGSCRFWQLWLRLWAVCFRLEPSVRFMGHLSEHSKWLTANVGCCCSFRCSFFRFYCCQWLLVCCSVAASDCQSV